MNNTVENNIVENNTPENNTADNNTSANNYSQGVNTANSSAHAETPILSNSTQQNAAAGNPYMAQFIHSRYNRVLPKVLILAILSIILLYRNRGSICYPIFMASMLAVLAWDSKSMGKNLIRDLSGKIDIKLFYCVSLMLLSISKAVTSSADLRWGDGLGILLISLCLFLKIYCNFEAKEVTSQLFNLGRMLILPLEHIDKPFTDFSIAKKMDQDTENPAKKTMRSILLGLLIAIPLLTIILALLGSADLIFGDILEDIIDSISLVDHMEDLFFVPVKFIITVIALYAWFAMLPATKFSDMKEGKRFDAVVAITFNSLIAIVYILFSGIQFVYLVGRMELPKGYTYAEYAHEGFYQLLAVTILNLILVSFCKKHFAENKILRAILFIINMCTIIMIASSALRMFLYVQVYGLTHLRVYVLWLLVVLTVWTLLLTVQLFKTGIPFFRITVIFVTVWYLMLAYSLPDTWIAAYDISLQKLPEHFITSELYPDAAPIIKEDGRCWDKYCEYMEYDVKEYNNRTLFQQVRQFNFCEYRAMKLISK